MTSARFDCRKEGAKLNIGLIYQNIADMVEQAPAQRLLILGIALPVCGSLLVLLGVVTFEPVLTKRRLGRASVSLHRGHERIGGLCCHAANLRPRRGSGQ